MSDPARDQQVLDYVENSLLRTDEILVWKGRPDPMAYIRKPATLVQVPFGLFFFGFAVFWTIGASQGSTVFGLFGVPFMAVGLWIASKPLRTYRRAARTYYAVTDQRILIVSAGRSYTVNTIHPGDIVDYERTDRPDGTGSIRLRTTERRYRRTRSRFRGTRTMNTVAFTDGLWGIADVKGAADAVAALQAKA